MKVVKKETSCSYLAQDNHVVFLIFALVSSSYFLSVFAKNWPIFFLQKFTRDLVKAYSLTIKKTFKNCKFQDICEYMYIFFPKQT